MKIRNAKSEEIEDVKNLIIEYTKFLNRNLDFQGLKDELEDLRTKYSAVEGELLVAVSDDNEIIGIVAYHRHDNTRCEMKRLFVKPEYRKLKLGEKLIFEIINHAKQSGYKEMVLDTIEPLKAAIYLYKKFGFVECEPYYNNPMDDVIYMKLDL
ncbi:GNAT family N-acetyltransferase [bacterium]|nr:GNAT family N-acetyltransferase [bacterium]